MNTRTLLFTWIGLATSFGSLQAQAADTPPPPPAPAGEVNANTTTPPPTSPTSPTPPPDFRHALTPYGTWTTLAPYGNVWIPHGMPAGWRPYTTGRWAYSDEVGWTWVADEPWGWAPFHYGRWTLDPSLGWAWIPGDVWAPAWVAWREGGDFTGWAPLPPSVGWIAGVGLDFGRVDLSLAISDPWWNFVPVRHLCHPHVCDVIVVRERVPVLVHETTIERTNLMLEHGRVANRAVRVADVEKASGETVTHVVLHTFDRPERLQGVSLSPNEIAVVRPETPSPKVAAMPLHPTPPATTLHREPAPLNATIHSPSVPSASPPEAKPAPDHRPAGSGAHHQRHTHKEPKESKTEPKTR